MIQYNLFKKVVCSLVFNLIFSYATAKMHQIQMFELQHYIQSITLLNYSIKYNQWTSDTNIQVWLKSLDNISTKFLKIYFKKNLEYISLISYTRNLSKCSNRIHIIYLLYLTFNFWIKDTPNEVINFSNIWDSYNTRKTSILRLGCWCYIMWSKSDWK